MFSSFMLTYSTAVIPLVVRFRLSVTQDLSDSSITVELLDNRSTYCLGETARIVATTRMRMDQYWQKQWAQRCALQVGVNVSGQHIVHHDTHTSYIVTLAVILLTPPTFLAHAGTVKETILSIKG